MKIEKTFLRSKVGRRIMGLFVFCALVPISALAIVSFTRVSGELDKQNERQLHQSCKALVMSILERMNILENEFKALCSNPIMSSSAFARSTSEAYGKDLKNRFKALAFITHLGELFPRFGQIQKPPVLSAEETQHLRSGNTLILTHSSSNGRSKMYMMRLIDPSDRNQGRLYGEINTLYLWLLNQQPEDVLPYRTELFVLDNSNQVIYSTMPAPPTLRERPEYSMPRTGRGIFEWKHEKDSYMASFRALNIKYNPEHPQWTVVLTVPKETINRPMAQFKQIFPLIVLFSFWVVLLLAFIQIRRTTHPLEKLGEGTRRIAMRDFDSRVTVTSGDEFEELATSFNDMARQLGRQFNALTTMSEIDRAILSALDTERIIRTVFSRMREFLPYDSVSVTLLDSKGQNSGRTYMEEHNRLELFENVAIPAGEVEKFVSHQELLLVNSPEKLPAYLANHITSDVKLVVLLPLFIKNALAGIITLGSLSPSPPEQEDLDQARQLADQVAVALANAQLIEDLDALNWGTLRALARAVDAKSPWTAGHSERVTEKALQIGQAMGLTPEALDDLHRGGLLHDIGKIGIPVSILDKPGKLDDEEFQLIRSHSGMGARILEPIAAYANAIPIVLQHHEHFNGKGYPDGLSGEEISLGARILAVADVYDALVSDRPYRTGMDRERVIGIIKEEAGKQFDPRVVEALLEVIGQEGVER
ncbi:MAG: HD domain-containing phosphohydrolase [Desulfobacteraceae bacterium]|jgi:HAMP domain-containing protein